METLQVFNPTSQPCEFREEVLSRSETFENDVELLLTDASGKCLAVKHLLRIGNVDVCFYMYQSSKVTTQMSLALSRGLLTPHSFGQPTSAVDGAHYCTGDGIFAGNEYKVFAGAGNCGVEQFTA